MPGLIPRILIVDDESEILEVIVETFADAGLTNVMTCTSGLDAQAILSENSFDAVVLDYNLPGKSGLQLLSMIAGDPKNTHAKRYFMSGYIGPETAAHIQLFRVDKILTKPFDFRMLVDLIKSDLSVGELVADSELPLLDGFRKILTRRFTEMDPAFSLKDPVVTRGAVDRDQFRAIVPIFGSPYYGAIALSFSRAGLIRYVGRAVDTGMPLDSSAPHDVAKEICNQIAGELKMQLLNMGASHVQIGLPISDRMCEISLPVSGRVFAYRGEFCGGSMRAEICLPKI